MRRIVRNLLKESGFSEADEAEDGVAALQKLRSSKFDFVVTDINMPNMNGFQLLAEVKSDEKLKHLPVLMVTAEARKEDIVGSVAICVEEACLTQRSAAAFSGWNSSSPKPWA